MSFCTVINCMDGRVQDPVNRYLRERFGVDYVDVITSAGPVRRVASGNDDPLMRRVDVSVLKHGSRGIAVVAHHDCAGNPRGEEDQRGQLRQAVSRLAESYPGLPVLGLWVDEHWVVSEALVREPVRA